MSWGIFLFIQIKNHRDKNKFLLYINVREISCIVLSFIHSKKVKKILAFLYFFIYNQIVVTLIALKREVAASVKAVAGFPWSECQVVKTGDKSLYELQSIYCRKIESV